MCCVPNHVVVSSHFPGFVCSRGLFAAARAWGIGAAMLTRPVFLDTENWITPPPPPPVTIMCLKRGGLVLFTVCTFDICHLRTRRDPSNLEGADRSLSAAPNRCWPSRTGCEETHRTGAPLAIDHWWSRSEVGQKC